MSLAADANEMAQMVARLGLIDDGAARELVYEMDNPRATAEEFIEFAKRRSLLTPWQAGKLLKGETEGYVLGGYKLLYKIASGSFGRVYRSVEPRSGQIVAVKVLRQKWSNDPHWVETFEREGKIGMSLRHPNIVEILAVSRDPKTLQYFLVMEFIEGGSLRDLLKSRGKVDIPDALRLIEECASGLAFAYSKGLTHRDIKLTNVLVSTTTKQAKLVDFGLGELTKGSQLFLERVKSADEDDNIDRTLDYAGLEKTTNAPKGDVRSDIYFIGLMLYELITGEALLKRTKDRNVVNQKRRYEELEDMLSKKGPQHNLPLPVQKLIARSIYFDPNERFQSPELFVEAIKNCRAELSGNAVRTRLAPGATSIYVVEGNQKLQDVFRHKFRKMGFRVMIAADPNQAVLRYKTGPYHALVIDAGTAGREGVEAFEKVIREADKANLDCAAVLILNEEQANWKEGLKSGSAGTVFVRPITMAQLHETVAAGVPSLGQAKVESALRT
jgi:serine/threonine protein kinase